MEVYLTMLYSSAVLYIVMLHKVVIPFASVNEILKCDYIFERVNLLGSSSVILFKMLLQGGSNV